MRNIRFQSGEPFARTLARNGTLAVLVSGVLAFLRHDVRAFIPLTVVALWPTLGGHYIEVAFLSGLRARIPQGRLAQAAIRLLVWSVGGILLYFCVAATARVLLGEAPPWALWWFGGLLFPVVELVVHAGLAIRGLPNVYDGRG